MPYRVIYEDPERETVHCLTKEAAQFIANCHRDIIANQAARINAAKDRWGTVKVEVVK
jgi:hypothetical protein